MNIFLSLVIIPWVSIFVPSEDAPTLNQVLGSCTTPIGHQNQETRHNIRLSSQLINQVVLEPEEIFSFNKRTGDRSIESGYQMAPVLLNNKRITMPGGGVCEVSSTLYNTVLRANLKILERHKHSSPVSYVPLGLDATVSAGVKDLVFQNTTGQRIRIEAFTQGNRLVITIFGEKAPDFQYEIESDWNEIPVAENNGIREIRNGFEARVYRLKMKNNEVLERQFLYSDYYPPQYYGTEPTSGSDAPSSNS